MCNSGNSVFETTGDFGTKGTDVITILGRGGVNECPFQSASIKVNEPDIYSYLLELYLYFANIL